MLPDRVSNPGPLTYESGALPIALRGPATEGEGRDERSYSTLKGSIIHFIIIIAFVSLKL